MEDRTFSLTLTRRDGYEFAVRFEPEGIDELTVDEPPPLGTGAGPNPTALLGAAVGSCLGASLLFCLHKSRVALAGLTTAVRGTIERNPDGRLRVSRLEVRLTPELNDPEDDDAAARLARCTDKFERFCTVTQSVRQGVEVDVVVEPTVPALVA